MLSWHWDIRNVRCEIINWRWNFGPNQGVISHMRSIHLTLSRWPSCRRSDWWSGDHRPVSTVEEPRLLDIFWTQPASITESGVTVFTSDSCSAIYAEGSRVIMHYTVIVIGNSEAVDSTVSVLMECLSEAWWDKTIAHVWYVKILSDSEAFWSFFSILWKLSWANALETPERCP